MRRRLLLSLGVLLAAGVWAAAAPAGAQAPARIWLPLLASLPSPVEVVVTAYGVECEYCYPSYPYVKGYLMAKPGAPPSIVTLGVTVHVSPYAPPGGPPAGAPYSYLARFSPSQQVTVPGTPNPFVYSQVMGKGGIAIGGDVRVLSVTLLPEPGTLPGE